ncbi:hypothetical protein PIB30_092008 [Stylosanthes scabra]|uniref:Uncharacterized protein n=1 Tax=Stylosanthes scabra TaxID=79078 RepID=A0ABU6TU52_9FABA|nr:hypothetical protein [Stylosanthes scabra]
MGCFNTQQLELENSGLLIEKLTLKSLLIDKTVRVKRNEKERRTSKNFEKSPTHMRGSWCLGVLQPDPTTPRQPLIKPRCGQQLCLSTLTRGNPRIYVDRHSSTPEASIAHA